MKIEQASPDDSTSDVISSFKLGNSSPINLEFPGSGMSAGHQDYITVHEPAESAIQDIDKTWEAP